MLISFVIGVVIGLLISAAVVEKYMGSEVAAKVKAGVEEVKAELDKAHAAYRAEATAANAKLQAKLVQAHSALEQVRKDLADKIAPK
ncbi:MAG: hypothetical protein ACYCZJ_13135 [Sulfuriferula sp.]